MRIGFISGEYPPQQGGVGDFTRELARALIAAGHTAQVITGCRTQDAQGTRQEDGITVHRTIHSWGRRCWGEIADIAGQQHFDVLNLQYEPAAYAMQVGVNFLPSGWVRRRIKTPIVTTFHDLLVPYLFPKAGPLRWKVVEYLARRGDAVIVTNAEDRARLVGLQPQVIPIGSNIDPALAGEFNWAVERSRWGVQPAEFVLGYFGFLNLSKGGSDLMQALKILRDDGRLVRLLLIGGRTGSSDPANAEYAAQVENLIDSLGLKERVITTGYLEPPEVSRALLICDVMVLPYIDGASLRRGSLLAAIAHGRAIVTTEPRYPIGGLTNGKAVMYVRPGDAQALATAVQRVLIEEALRACLQANVSEAAKLYTWDRIAAQTLEVFERTTHNMNHAIRAS